jgi:hypothetical protein
MLKIRYFQIELPIDLRSLSERIRRIDNSNSSRQIKLTQVMEDDIVSSYRVTRLITIRRFLDDGSTIIESASTTDQHTIRLFRKKEKTYLSIIDPPRGSKTVCEYLDDIFNGTDYFIEPIEITTSLIDRHVAKFDSAKLVSAKIRDFEVYEGAVGRLEIASHAGLIPTIAPFLENKFHRIDSLTYEVTRNFHQGLILYSRNGTIKVSAPLVEQAFPLFEECLD